jgi:hypothetical protein
VIIDFEETTPRGVVKFNGELTPEEVSFLLRYALLTLLSRGMLPNAVIATYPESNGEEDPNDEYFYNVPEKKDMN